MARRPKDQQIAIQPLKLLLAAFLMFSSTFSQTTSVVSPPERVHLGDLIDVDVVGNLEFDWRGTLTPEGFLDGIDQVEEQIYGLCRTEAEIASDLTREFAKILRSPEVRVRIVDRSRRADAIVDGAVKNPYRFQLRRAVHLNELIVLAGGITDRSNGEIVIFRPKSLSCEEDQTRATGDSFVKASQDAGSQVTKITVADLLSGKANPQILSGDIVTISEAAPIYIIGGVNSPRQISSRSQTTVSRAIASAGGLAKDGIADKITIHRRKGNSTDLIPVSLSKIKADPDQDLVLNPFDIVDVAQKGRENRRFPPRLDPEPDRNRRLGLMIRVID